MSLLTILPNIRISQEPIHVDFFLYGILSEIQVFFAFLSDLILMTTYTKSQMSSEGELENLVCSRPVVVLDFGSLITKSGFCGEDTPTTFPTIVGLSETPSSKNSEENKRTFLAGHEAHINRSKLSIINPVKRGLVEDWDAMEKLLQFSFEDVLEVSPESSHVLVADSSHSSKENRERIVKLLFEKFKVESCFVAMDSVLSLFSSGRTSGLTVESGEDITSAVPIFEGYALRPMAAIRVHSA